MYRIFQKIHPVTEGSEAPPATAPIEPHTGSAPLRPAWLNVDLDAVRANVRSVSTWVGPRVGVMAVVKANAYGHGLVPVARAAAEAGASWLGVAILEEALALRESGVSGRILVMGASDPACAPTLVHYGIDAVVSSSRLLHALAAAAQCAGQPARIHVKVDTGMGRVGLSPREAAAFFTEAASLSGVAWAGLMTHFATADDDPDFAREQWRRFAALVPAALSARTESAPLLLHAANSAAVCTVPQSFRLDHGAGVRPMVRAGLLTYGVPPVDAGPCPTLRPALALRARITQVRAVPSGATVSYGATFTTQRPSTLALVSLGYADGYSRSNGNRAWVLLRGGRAPVVGRVCMDQFVVDATDTGAEAGEEVTLLGRQGAEEIAVNELARWSGTVHHEVLARLGERLPRVYVSAPSEQATRL